MRGIAHLHLVEAARTLFAVAAYERDSASLVHEGDYSGDLARLDAEFGSDLVHNGDLVDAESGDSAFSQFHGGYGTG